MTARIGHPADWLIALASLDPILEQRFGSRLREHGSVRLRFRSAPRPDEKVAAAIADESRDRVEIRLEGESGRPIATGVASVEEAGDDEEWVVPPPGVSRARSRSLRILGSVRPRDGFPTVETNAPRPADGLSAWIERLSRAALVYLDLRAGAATAVCGGLELRLRVPGAAAAGGRLRIGGQVLATAERPRSESVWYEGVADDRADHRVAELRLELRYLKRSSPLHARQ